MIERKRPLRLLYFGMQSALSFGVLSALLAGDANICAVIVPAERKSGGDALRLLAPPVKKPTNAAELPLLQPYLNRTILHLAWERGIPTYELSDPGAAQTLTAVNVLQPDLACVACFSQKLPVSLLTVPPLGFLNVHPSLLPAYRGPAPLFWQFRNGETATGVTLHQMDEGLDTGAIVAQRPLLFHDGITENEAERLCAAAAGQLLLETLDQFALQAIAPQPAGGSYHPWPCAADFALDTAWSARRAFNFMRATAGWGRPYPVEIEGRMVELLTAVSYDPHRRLPKQIRWHGNRVQIQFKSGILEANNSSL